MNMLSKSDSAPARGFRGGFPAMDSWMRGFLDRFGSFSPELFSGSHFESALEVEVGEKEVTAKLPCAGCCPEDFVVEIVGDFLTVNVKHCEKCTPQKDDGKHYICKERSSAEFEESLRLPVAVNGSGAKAKYVDGVLVLTIPRDLADNQSKARVIKVRN